MTSDNLQLYIPLIYGAGILSMLSQFSDIIAKKVNIVIFVQKDKKYDIYTIETRIFP